MAVGNIPTPVVSTVPSLLTAGLHGNVTDNQRDLIVQVKNKWLAGGWFVVQSYSAKTGTLPAAGVDAWADYTHVLGSGGGGTGQSWMVFGNAANASQICLYCTVGGNGGTGWSEFQIIGAAAGGFSGGTTLARPTATNEMIDTVSPTSFLGTGPVGNPQFYAVTWVASDASYLRTAFFYAGKLKSFWSFDQLHYGPNPWTTPLLIQNFHWGNTDYTVTGNRASTTQFMTNWGSAGVWKQLLIPGVTPTLEQANGVLEAGSGAGWSPDQTPLANAYTSQYFWVAPMGFATTGNGAAQNGFWGYAVDQWWTQPSIFADGDTMGDAYNYIIIGQMVLQWGLGAVGTKLGGASTNYPTARWYGRDGAGSVCTCGPDTCNTPTTPLITLRNGAKELADKVNDASVSDITWNVWINQGIESLWSLVATAFSDQFFKTFDFTLTGGAGGNILDVSTVPTVLANDFRRVRMVEWMPDTAARQKLRAFNWNEKDSRIGSFGGSPWSNDRRYRLMGQKLYVEPYEQAAGSYRLYYVPGPSMKLALTCDAIDPAVNEWAEFPMIFAAMKALGKEESDDSQLARRLMELKAEILDAASSRNDGDADTIADVEGGGGYFG